MDPLRLQVLLVTEDESLLDEVRAALGRLRVGVDLHHLPDAGTAASFLDGRGRYEGSADPDVLFVDHAGGPDGARSLLEHLAAHERLAGLPVVAVSSETEKLAEFRLHAVLPRPLAEEDLHRVLSYLDET